MINNQKKLLSFFIIIGCIFLAEVVAMWVIFLLDISSAWGFVFLDASIMTLLVIPALYYFSLRPLQKQINERIQAESALHSMVEEQESLIAKRTQDLETTNTALENEIEERKKVEEVLRETLVETQKRETEVAALFESARAVLDTNEFKISSRRIFDSCKKLVGATAGYIALMEGDENSVVFLDTGKYNCTVDPSLPMPIRGLREKVYQEGITQYENGFMDTEWVQFLPEGHTRTENVLFAPLTIKGAVVGLMGLANKPGGFTDRDATMVSAFAEVAAVALLNSSAIEALRDSQDQLEQRVQERTQELEQVNIALSSENEERRKIEKQLRIQTAALEAAANGIIITEPDGKIVWANHAFSEMTGYSPTEVLGKTPNFLHSGEHPNQYYEDLWKTILSGNTWRGELVNLRKDGREYTEFQTITPVVNEDGNLVNFIAIKQDITERKLFENQLEQTNRDLLLISEAEHKQRLFAETLYRASKQISRSLDLDSVTESLFDYLYRILDYDAAYIVLANSESSLAVRSSRQMKVYPGSHTDLDNLLDARQSQALQTLLFGEAPIIIPDLQQLEDWTYTATMGYMRNWLSIPLQATENVIGLVVLVKEEADYFQEEQSQLAQAVVSQAAVAIQNSWLFEQVRAGRERLKMLSRRLVEVQETERREIARELHDETSQAMTSIRLGLQLLEREINNPQKATAHIHDLHQVSEGVMDSLHRIAMNLRPASLDHLGLIATIKNLVETTGEKHGLAARFRAIGYSSELTTNGEVDVALYRIVQESLTNIVRHAKATRADVILEKQVDRYRLIIEDDGIGFNPEEVQDSRRLGLVGMQERIEQLGGKLLIESQPGSGTTLVAEIPYDN